MSAPPVLWNDSSAMPVGMSLDQLLYRIRRSDADDGLIFDSVTLDDILEEAEAIFELDALVATQSSLGRKVRSLERVMSAGGGELEVVASQVSSPFKRQGVVNVAAIFELSDGQTVTVMFHNPDAGTAKSLKPTDELISWKWMLNKKDITIVVAPERGSDLPIRQVARRIMKLAEKNSKTFARMNQKRAERLAYIESLKGEIGELETELDGLTRQIEIARIEAEDKALNTPKPLTKQEGLDLLDELRPWLSRQQYRAMADVIRKGEEGAAYIDRAQALASIIDGMAKSYEQDGKGMEATAYLHYFRGGGDWYITEKDAKGDGTEQAFGWADPGQGSPELGYIGVDELTDAGVELDLHFEPKPLSQAVSEGGEGGSEQEVEGFPDAADAPGALPQNPQTADDFARIIAAGDEAKERYRDQLDSFFQGRVIEVRNALRELGWDGEPYGDLSKGGATLVVNTEQVGAGGNAVGVSYTLSGVPGFFMSDSLEHTPKELAELIDLGVVSRAGEPPAEPTGKDTPTGVNADGELEPEGAENVVKTAKGTEVQTGFTVVEAEELIASHDINGDPNPAFPTELQPRDRGRDASIAWVKKTARQLDPDSLGRTRRADTGAPIVGPDRVVESGNGRTMAIQEAYRSGSADEYREWLIEEAHHYNLDAARVRAMKAPVLVRVRTSALDRREFAVEANQDDKLSMTGTEKARADADRLDEALVAKLADDGNLLAASNRDFIMGFLQSLGDTEAAQYMTSDGNPTGALVARIQAAIFAKAYNDDRLLEMTADASKPEVANVVNALNVAAPEFIRAQAADQAGTDALTNQLVDSVEVSLNEQAVQAIIDATNLVRRAKADGSSVEEVVNQMGLFGDIPPATSAMALFINQNNRSAKRLGLAFKAMAAFVRQEAERGQTVDMFGEGQQASLEQIIDAANRELEKEYGEGSYAIESLDMFSAPPDEAPAGDGQPSEDDIEQARQATDTEPTEAEKESGDYAKGEVEILGLTVAIENPKGSERSGTTQEGEEWSVSMAHDYGYIKGTKGADGDEVDVFIGPDLESERVFVINQVGKDGELDEHKVMLGFATKEAAEQGYLSSYRAGWDGLGSTQEMSVDELKAWLPSAAEGKPAADPAPGAEPPAPADNEEEAMRRNDRQFLQSVIDGTVPDMLSPDLADRILAVMERQSGDAEMEDLIERAGAAYERAMLSATEDL
ncbi:defense against restriction DarA-related protein [Vreelandella aquamarina]|uniref:defense against restriction DarA-related protein n=1 Tax=Vreelandella aquamarina TaxID=77097 RepID=UPI0007833F84|nr:DUF2958 domain-containing protein [Halomonas axialensis]